MKVYISGAVTGTKDYVERFEAAETEINKAGDKAINPVRIIQELPNEPSWAICMAICIALIDSCECMYVLKNWRDSKGVKMEIKRAEEKGIPVFYEEDYEEIKEDTVDVNALYLKKEKNALEKLDEITKELNAYRSTGLSVEDLKTIDESYRDMAYRLSQAEKELAKTLDKLGAIREVCKGGAA